MPGKVEEGRGEARRGSTGGCHGVKGRVKGVGQGSKKGDRRVTWF